MRRGSTWMARLGNAGAAALLVVLAAVTALSPAAGAACAPLLAAVAVAVAHPSGAARAVRTTAAAAGLVVLFVLVLVAPAAAVGAAAAAVALGAAAGAAWRVREPVARVIGRAARVVARPLLVALSVLLLLAAAFAVALRPGPVAGAIALVALLAAAARTALPAGVPVARRAPRVLVALGGALAAVACAVGLAVALSLWPALVLVTALVAGVLLLSWRRPALGFAAAVLLFGFEGSVKILLGLEITPLPAGNRAVGAALLDLALFGSVASVLLHDRLRTPRALWAAAGRLERIAMGVVGAWLVLSVLQIAQGGDLTRGVLGFRLFQAYTVVAVAALVVFANRRHAAAGVRTLLGIGLVIGLYAAFRTVVGAADAEARFALAVPTVSTYGDALRAIGSFSSAIGLMSFLTPLAVFSLALGFLVPRLRALAWTVGAVAVIGLIGSYSRTSLFAVALGVGIALLLAFARSGTTRRRKLAAAALVVAGIGAMYGGVLVASQASPALRERAEGMLNPLGDSSTRLRFETWRREARDAVAHPLGQGVGAVGAASDADRRKVRTTDNSFLKVFIEQGVLGVTLFVVGLASLVVLLARRIRRAEGERRAVGIAALAAFVAFLAIAAVGESVEQPGKVLAWGLLGLAAAQAFAVGRGAGDADRGAAA